MMPIMMQSQVGFNTVPIIGFRSANIIYFTKDVFQGETDIHGTPIILVYSSIFF